MSRLKIVTKQMVNGEGIATKVHHITWNNKPILKDSFNKLNNWIRSSKSYSIVDKPYLATLGRFVAKLKGITRDQAVAIRNIVIKDKIIKNYGRMNHMIAKIAAAYSAGSDILQLSHDYDFPPLNLLRGILTHLGLPIGNLYNIFANKEDPSYLLTGRDLEQFYIANSTDAESVINQQHIARIAAINEAKFVEYIGRFIAIRSQDDLATEQIAEFGRAVLTPDVLFVDEVFINGVRCHWIDYKDYTGTGINFLCSSNIAQAAKYNNKWGPGALCYQKSFVDDLEIPGAILLDGSAVPVKYQHY